MNIYVAGSTRTIREVRQIQTMCRLHNHKITHDWTDIVEGVGGPANEHHISPGDQAQFARNDALGVYKADLVIISGHPHVELCGTYIEMGLAIAWNRPIWLYGQFRKESVFFHMDHVQYRFTDPLPLDQELARLDPVAIERAPARMIVNPESLPDA